MKINLNLTVKYDGNNEEGWVAQCNEIPAAITQGATKEEAKGNYVDASV